VLASQGRQPKKAASLLGAIHDHSKYLFRLHNVFERERYNFDGLTFI